MALAHEYVGFYVVSLTNSVAGDVVPLYDTGCENEKDETERLL